MHIVCIHFTNITIHISFSSFIEPRSYSDMCFSKEISGEKPINVISENPKLILEEFDDNCDYIDLDDRTELSCDNKTLSLIQLNIRGLFSKNSALNLLLTENVGTVRPDLVLL